jgi:hypothetical protein
MSEPVFNVILEGTVKPGRMRSEVEANLSRIFKKDPETVGRLLSGKARTIRQGIDLEAARRYQHIIEKAGAVCRIESTSPPASVPEKPASDQPEPDSEVVAVEPCPRCGYVPTNEDDVMIVRGDCPRCGLMVRASVNDETSEQASELEDSEAEALIDVGPAGYAPSAAASLSRRALASIYTFAYFLIVYCFIVLLFIVCFIPLDSVPRYIARDFLDAAYTVAPSLMTAVGILVVSFFVPLFSRGRSWGQQAFSLEPLYTPEAQSGGLAMSLAFRVGAMLLLTLAPGLIVVWTAVDAASVKATWVEPAIMLAMAVVGWSVSWIVCLMSSSRRSIPDRAGGTIQTEIGLMPPHPMRRALGPLLLVLAVLCALGLISHLLAIVNR